MNHLNDSINVASSWFLQQQRGLGRGFYCVGDVKCGDEKWAKMKVVGSRVLARAGKAGRGGGGSSCSSTVFILMMKHKKTKTWKKHKRIGNTITDVL